MQTAVKVLAVLIGLAAVATFLNQSVDLYMRLR